MAFLLYVFIRFLIISPFLFLLCGYATIIDLMMIGHLKGWEKISYPNFFIHLIPKKFRKEGLDDSTTHKSVIIISFIFLIAFVLDLLTVIIVWIFSDTIQYYLIILAVNIIYLFILVPFVVAEVTLYKERKKEYPHTDKKAISMVFLILGVAAPILGLITVVAVSDVSFFGWAASLRYSWILYLFIFIPISNLIYGFIGKKRRWIYFKNIVVACAVTPLLVLYGSYGLIFASSIDYTDAIFRDAENKTSLVLPSNIQCVTELDMPFTGDLSIAKIVSSSEQTTFENSLLSAPWIDTFPSAIKNALPDYVSSEVLNFDYYCFYDVTSDSFNTIPVADGTYDTVFLAYQSSIAKIVAFDNYQVIVNS